MSDGPSKPAQPTASAADVSARADRSAVISRSVERVPVVSAKRWTTADLDLRLTPEKNASTHGELKRLSRISVTGLHRTGYAQVVVNKKIFWVDNDYLSATKPTASTRRVNAAKVSAKVAGSPCPGTASVERGLTPAAINVYRVICHAFPQITSYGGYSNHGEHSSGRALDIMTSDVALGTAIADYLRAHAAELNIFDVLWRQHIFTQQRASEGFRSMASRGSATANHYDHVHVSVN